MNQYCQLYTLGELYMVNTYMSLGQGSLTQLASLNATGNASMYLNTGTLKADIKVMGNLALHSFAKLEGQLRLCVGGAITKESSSIIAATVEQSACDNMTELASGAQRTIHLLGSKSFELCNHLGNVLTVVTDKKYKLTTAWNLDVASATDYYAFGSNLKSLGEYRYGFNNQEKDNEWNGNYAFKYRVHDARLGRFFSVDPLYAKYAYNSTYAFAENRVIDGIDLEGKEHLSVNNTGMSPEAIEKAKNKDGTYTFRLGEVMINAKMFTHNGEKYFNIGFHVYYDGNFKASGKESQQMSEWIFTDIQNLSPGNNNENFVPWTRDRDCASCVRDQFKIQGKTNLGKWSWDPGIMVNDNSTDDGKYVTNKKNMGLAIDYINRQLEAGKIVAVGVDDELYQTAVANSSTGQLNLYGTDHFVVITGRTIINNERVFTFWENAVGDTPEEASNGVDITKNLIKPYKNFHYSSPHWFGKTGRVTWIKKNGK